MFLCPSYDFLDTYATVVLHLLYTYISWYKPANTFLRTILVLQQVV